MHRCQDVKRHSLLRFELFKKIDKFLSLNLRNILISPLEGEKKFLSELCELSNKGRLGILAQREAGFEPSPAFVMLTGVRKRLLPLTKREGCDSVISSDFKSKISITNENNLSCKELSALVPQYLRNFSETVFSRFTSLFSHKCTAFTLAEVLITLGIIGIVAALTIPVLYSKYQQKVTETRFERVYSDLTKAFNAGAIENGEEYFMQSWQMSYNDYIEYVYQNYLKPHIRMMDVVTFGGLEKKYNAKNPRKAFWSWSQHIFIIDKRTFISFDSDGKEVNKSSLSAGEKQLMVISLLWALALCSKKKLPVIIDTPLSRLDSAHRVSLIQTYFPQASEQTIILSTDSEIDKNYYEIMKDNIGDEFTLIYDDETKSTTIKKGYFLGVEK